MCVGVRVRARKPGARRGWARGVGTMGGDVKWPRAVHVRTEVPLGLYAVKLELHSRCSKDDGPHQFVLLIARHTFFFLGKVDQSLVCVHTLFPLVAASGQCGPSDAVSYSMPHKLLCSRRLAFQNEVH